MQLIHPYLSDERPAMNRRYNRIIGILFFNIIIISTLSSSTKSRGRSGYPSRLRTRSCQPTLCPGAAQAPWPWCSSRASTTRAPGSACTPGTPDRGSSPLLWTAAGDPEELTREQEIELVTKETMELDIQMREREGEQVLCDEATRLPCVAHKVIFKWYISEL